MGKEGHNKNSEHTNTVQGVFCINIATLVVGYFRTGTQCTDCATVRLRRPELRETATRGQTELLRGIHVNPTIE